MIKKIIYSLYYTWVSSGEFFSFKIFKYIKSISWYIKDAASFYNKAKKLNSANISILYPCLNDKTEITPIDPIYFYQDCWAARKIFELKPEHHYDIGSSIKTIGLISQYVPVTMVDIRPIELKLENLHFKVGTVLNLPFEDNSIRSISSLCVIEHIGLGRYGDPVDPEGSQKAIKELVRVTAPGGYILFSVPVSDKNQVYFNAHRTFTRSTILEYFYECELVEERYIYAKSMQNNYDSAKGFGTGLYLFRKGKD